MPKKTKKEKIIAQYRKKMKVLSQLMSQKQNLTFSENREKNDTPTKKLDQQTVDSHSHKERDKKIDTQFFDYNLAKFLKEDFRKSALLSFFIIALEFLIYFVIIKK